MECCDKDEKESVEETEDTEETDEIDEWFLRSCCTKNRYYNILC
jgi:hypothetical protein